MPGSVSTRSTGFSTPSVSYKDEQMDHADPSNPHPNASTMPKECYGSMGSGSEYHETPTAGIDKTGVGNLGCNDAACEKIVKHPTAADLSQAGSMRSR